MGLKWSPFSFLLHEARTVSSKPKLKFLHSIALHTVPINIIFHHSGTTHVIDSLKLHRHPLATRKKTLQLQKNLYRSRFSRETEIIKDLILIYLFKGIRCMQLWRLRSPGPAVGKLETRVSQWCNFQVKCKSKGWRRQCPKLKTGREQILLQQID